MKEEPRIRKVFEDRYLLVLNKPRACLSLRAETSDLFSLEDWMRQEYSELFRAFKNKESDFWKRAGVVHRLDKDTSGLVLVAKDEISFLRLQAQFKKRTVKKTYLALVAEKTPQNGVIEVPIARCSRVFGRWEVNPEGLMAKTVFLCLKFYDKEGESYSLLELRPETGRTHQIRVHLKYMGWPIVGDSIYGGKRFAGLKRLFLHAKEIEFKHPETGERVSFETNLPRDLKQVLKRLENVRIF